MQNQIWCWLLFGYHNFVITWIHYYRWCSWLQNPVEFYDCFNFFMYHRSLNLTFQNNFLANHLFLSIFNFTKKETISSHFQLFPLISLQISSNCFTFLSCFLFSCFIHPFYNCAFYFPGYHFLLLTSSVFVVYLYFNVK